MLRIKTFLDIKEMTVTQQVLNRLLGDKDQRNSGLNLSAVQCIFGFDNSKTYCWAVQLDDLFLFDDWQAKFYQIIPGIHIGVCTKTTEIITFKNLADTNCSTMVIGSEVCSELWKNYSALQGKAKRMGSNFYEHYFKLGKRLKLAAKYHGIVVIHPVSVKVVV